MRLRLFLFIAISALSVPAVAQEVRPAQAECVYPRTCVIKMNNARAFDALLDSARSYDIGNYPAPKPILIKDIDARFFRGQDRNRVYEVSVIEIGRNTTTSDVLNSMTNKGIRPARIEELYAFYLAFPVDVESYSLDSKTRRFCQKPIAALGSRIVDDGEAKYLVPTLFGRCSSRPTPSEMKYELATDYEGIESEGPKGEIVVRSQAWRQGTRFLTVREIVEPSRPARRQ